MCNTDALNGRPATPEFCAVTEYAAGCVVWFLELKYVATDFVWGESPESSKYWEVYWRTVISSLALEVAK